MKIQTVLTYLETIAPLSLQESYDNAGLIVGDRTTEVTGVLFCLDSTESVLEEAKAKGCNLVIAHHPIIFRGLTSLEGKNYVERTIIRAIKYNIAIYAIHTNLDNVLLNGVNGKIAETLGIRDISILSPKDSNNLTVGSGVIGNLDKLVPELEFFDLLKTKMKAKCIRHTALKGQPISKVAICGGSGSFLLKNAIDQKADVFVSSDFKYHEFFDADEKIVIADIGHFESEQYTINLLFDLITEKFSNFAGYCTEMVTNPINYY